MSDPVSSGDPLGASAATAASAFPAAGTTAPIGSFGTAKGSGLLRGKRPTPAAASAAPSAAASGYQPSTIEVLRPASEYKNPFTGETSVPTPVTNEPAPQAAPLPSVASAKESAPAPVVVIERAPVTAPTPVIQPVVASAPATAAASTSESELFPFSPTSAPERKPAAPAAKVELNILPTEEVKRPAVSWGENASSHNGDRRDERPTFSPGRREGREPRPVEPREPRREPAAGGARPERSSFPRDGQRNGQRDFSRSERPAAAAPAKKSGGFFGWLKSLFAEKPAATETRTDGRGERTELGRDGQPRHNRRRHRGGRGRGGDNRGPREQPRDPRDEPSSQGGEHQGEHRHEGGGGRRGGRGRNRDDRGGPRPEGQQGGGAI
ncbi:MAG: translation initiation factor IF-2 [Verrucomicrobia bacterium]|jgi:hypothetical protein|nr:MAG: translation initiation factor IF-2 [Verrucomicrobiota bacterium]